MVSERHHEIATPKMGTSNNNGLIGIDLNAGFLSICEVDRFGNPLKEWKIRTRCTEEQKSKSKPPSVTPSKK